MRPTPSNRKQPANQPPPGASGSSTAGSGGSGRGAARTPYQAKEVHEASGDEAEVAQDEQEVGEGEEHPG